MALVLPPLTATSSDVPPLSTWYDESNSFFVALLDLGETRSSDVNDGDDNEAGSGDGLTRARFQIFAIPSDDASSSSRGDNSDILSADQPFFVSLPSKLFRPGGNDESDSAANVIELAKLSLDGHFMALQLSDNVVRVVKVEHDQQIVKEVDEEDIQHPKQWTIDLSGVLSGSTPGPVPSAPHEVPPKRADSFNAGAVAGAAVSHAKRFLRQRNLPIPGGFGQSDDSSPRQNGNIDSTEALLPGGMFWIDRPSDSHPILILVTKTAVLLYKISPEKHSMRPLETLRYPNPSANGFWYENSTRSLMVGNFVHRMEDGTMRTLLETRAYKFRQRGDDADQELDLYRKGDPVSICFHPYVFGYQRNSGDDRPISLDEFALVSTYNVTYCVELGSNGTGHGVNVCKLDVKHKRILPFVQHEADEFSLHSDPSQSFVGVVDNVIVVIDRKASRSLVLDTAADAGTSNASGEIETESTSYFSCPVSCDSTVTDLFRAEDLSFLPPRYILDPQGRGRLYTLSLDLASLVQNTKLKDCPVPFLLRRQFNPNVSHDLICKCFIDILRNDDANVSELRYWINVVAQFYAENSPHVSSWDYNACLSLIPPAALLSEIDQNIFGAEVPELPDSCSNALTQTELLQKVLIPLSASALHEGNQEKMNLLCDFCLTLLSSLECRRIQAVPAFECLIVALLWRLGEGEEVVGMLSARVQWKRTLSFMDHSKNEENIDPSSKNAAFSKRIDVAQEAFAEMLVAISTDAEYNGPNKDRITDTVQSQAIDLLNNIGSYQVASRLLLSFGRVIDAVTICQKAIVPAKRTSLKQRQRPPSSGAPGRGGCIPTHGTRAFDFFVCAIEQAESMKNVGDRVRLLLNVHAFISDYDPDSMEMTLESTQGRDEQELQSALARKYGSFPSNLFDGKTSPTCISLRAMFGFPLAT